jgi:hypothetical protein
MGVFFVVVLQILRMKIAEFFTGNAAKCCTAAETARLGAENRGNRSFRAQKCVVRATVGFNLSPEDQIA